MLAQNPLVNTLGAELDLTIMYTQLKFPAQHCIISIIEELSSIWSELTTAFPNTV